MNIEHQNEDPEEGSDQGRYFFHHGTHEVKTDTYWISIYGHDDFEYLYNDGLLEEVVKQHNEWVSKDE